MPTTVTPAKRAGAERLGARIELAGTTTQDRWNRAVELVEAEGLTMVPPYDHPWIVAGQGTLGLEIAEDMPDVGTVLVPVGGGGLSAGTAAAIKLRAPNARVIGVEPSSAPKLTRARAAGRPVRLEATRGSRRRTARRGGRRAALRASRGVRRRRGARWTTPRCAARCALLFDRMKLVAEPSGAITRRGAAGGNRHAARAAPSRC